MSLAYGKTLLAVGMIQGLVVARAVRTLTTATATEFVRGGSTRTRGTVHVTGTCTVYCVLCIED